MNRIDLDKYISEIYKTAPEHPWPKYPTYAVYRHKDNRKWFAVVMEIPKTKLGIPEDGMVNVVNLKCDLMLIGSLLGEAGIHPGYHMNKAYWITLRLDGSVDDDKMRWLLGLSYDLTKPKKKAKK